MSLCSQKMLFLKSPRNTEMSIMICCGSIPLTSLRINMKHYTATTILYFRFFYINIFSHFWQSIFPNNVLPPKKGRSSLPESSAQVVSTHSMYNYVLTGYNVLIADLKVIAVSIIANALRSTCNMTGTVLGTSKALSHLILTTAEYRQCPLQSSEN